MFFISWFIGLLLGFSYLVKHWNIIGALQIIIVLISIISSFVIAYVVGAIFEAEKDQNPFWQQLMTAVFLGILTMTAVGGSATITW